MEKLLQRILKVDYSFPPHVRISDMCRDLVQKILVADPSKRLDLRQARGDAWGHEGAHGMTRGPREGWLGCLEARGSTAYLRRHAGMHRASQGFCIVHSDVQKAVYI